MIFDKWDIVVVPFPFADLAKSKLRPALILSKKRFNDSHSHTIMAMITSAKHSSWSSDVKISNLTKAGLTNESIIRFKLFTIDNRLIQKKIGKLAKQDSLRIEKQQQTII